MNSGNEDLLKAHLQADEQIVELIHPMTNKFFSTKDIFLIPFSLLWGGFAVFWEVIAIYQCFINNSEFQIESFIFPMFGIPFVLIGLYLILGRFFYKKWKKENTLYVITNKRLIRFSKTIFGNNDFSTKFIDTLDNISIISDRSGIGSVTFGSYSFPFAGMYENTGLDFLCYDTSATFRGFYDIHKPAQVYEKILSIKNSKSVQ